MFVQFNPEKYLFHLGDWVKPSDQKDMGLGTIAFHVQRSSAITRNTCSAKRQRMIKLPKQQAFKGEPRICC